MLRTIVAFRVDELGDWIAELECGHSRHVRHRPPWEVREWVTTEQGRAGMLGTAIECGACEAAGDG